MTWLVSYRSVSGEVVEVKHDTREQARDALTDQLINAAMVLWKIGESYPKVPERAINRRQEFFDRGDRFIHHVLRLVESTEGEYVIVGKQGRQWLLVCTARACGGGPVTPYRFYICTTCQGWGRVEEIEADGWRRSSGVCPACNGAGGEVWADEQTEAA